MISPYAKQGVVDKQTLSFDAYDKFIEDDFLQGKRIDTARTGVRTPVQAFGKTRLSSAT